MNFLSPSVLSIMAIISLITFVGSLIVIPIIISRLSNDYFLAEKPDLIALKDKVSLLEFIIQIIKNILGILFILAGIAMLILPGQGILTILIGLGITNFPGRNKLEHKLIKNKKVFKSLNWIRKRAGVEPFLYPG